MWVLELLKLIPEGLSLLGQGISAWSAHDTKKLDVSLEKYKVDGVVDQSLLQADVSVYNTQVQYQAQALAYKGERYLRYGFGYPLAMWWAAIMIDSTFHKLGYWNWRVEALPEQVTPYVPWIIGYLFLHSAVSSMTRKT